MDTIYEGSLLTKVEYQIGPNDSYSTGSLWLDGAELRNVKFFRSSPGSEEEHIRLNEIKDKSTQLRFKSLLVPLVVQRSNDGSFIHIGYMFETSFQEGMPLKPALFRLKNGLIDRGWAEDITNILDTVCFMHSGFLFHGNLSDANSYVFKGQSVFMVRPNKLRSSANEDNEELAKEDLRDLGRFLGGLVQGQSSSEWTDFLRGFNDFNFEWVKKHPVLRSPRIRFRCFRALVFRVQARWNLTYNQWETLKEFIDEAAAICPNWTKKIVKNTTYDQVYLQNVSKYSSGTNVGLLLFVDNYLKHGLARGSTMEVLEREVHAKFPAIFSRTHSIFASFSLNPENAGIKVIPKEY